jgi:chemotaxis protein histidine kinase CheA
MAPIEVAPHLVEALSIFKAEFETHYTYLTEALAELAASTDGSSFESWLTTKTKPLENRFHILKGSAGFLGLTAIKELTQKGEKLFKPGSPALSDPAKLKGDFSKVVEELGLAGKEL